MDAANARYIRLIEDGGIFSYSLAKGTFILPPHGNLLWENLREHLDCQFKKLGVKNVTLPTLIPLSLFEKEKRHIDGFAPELFLVSRKVLEQGKDDNNLDRKTLALRPTSEVLFYEWFSRILQSHKQLPLLYNQWGQVFRAEKNTKPFLRSTEFLWQEGHTLHIDEQEAQEFAQQILSIYREYAEKVLCLAVITGLKTTSEKFAGALESYTVECILPDLQCLQLATSHYFGKVFAKNFAVKFHSKENRLAVPFSTSWGTSTRSIGALVLAHSDERGLFFPFGIAPVQLAFIGLNQTTAEISEYFSSVYKEVSSFYRCQTYEAYKQFANNLSQADKEGCPLKIIIGSNDFVNGTFTAIPRHTPLIKTTLPVSELLAYVAKTAAEINDYLYQNSKKVQEVNTFAVENLVQLTTLINEHAGLFLFPFCNQLNCEKSVVERFSSFSFRCTKKTTIQNKCIFCAEITYIMAYFGRSY